MSFVTLEQLAALDHFLTDEEKLVRENVRRFVRERYLPRAAELFEKEQFPRDLIPEIADLGLLGASIDGYGCAGMNPVAYGLLLEELEYGDSGLRSFVSVQGSLAMSAIHFFGSEAQKRKVLPEMARGKISGGHARDPHARARACADRRRRVLNQPEPAWHNAAGRGESHRQDERAVTRSRAPELGLPSGSRLACALRSRAPQVRHDSTILERT
jgi:hypothetical protein